MKIIRAYELKRWDIFIKQGGVYLVIRIINGEIHYTGYNQKEETYVGNKYYIGAKSQERVEWIGVKPVKKKTRPIIEYKNGYDPTWKNKGNKKATLISYNSEYNGSTFRNLK